MKYILKAIFIGVLLDLNKKTAQGTPNANCGNIETVDSTAKKVAVYTEDAVIPPAHTCTWEITADGGKVAVAIVQDERATADEYVKVTEGGKTVNIYRQPGHPNSYISTGSSVTVVFPATDGSRTFKSFNVEYVKVAASETSCTDAPEAATTSDKSFKVTKIPASTIPKDVACTWTIDVKPTETLTVTVPVTESSTAQCVSVTNGEAASEKLICGVQDKNTFTSKDKAVTVKFVSIALASDVPNFDVHFELSSASKKSVLSFLSISLCVVTWLNLD